MVHYNVPSSQKVKIENYDVPLSSSSLSVFVLVCFGGSNIVQQINNENLQN